MILKKTRLQYFINKKLCNFGQIEICLPTTIRKQYILKLVELDNVLLIKIFIRKLKVDLKSLHSTLTHCSGRNFERLIKITLKFNYEICKIKILLRMVEKSRAWLFNLCALLELPSQADSRAFFRQCLLQTDKSPNNFIMADTW